MPKVYVAHVFARLDEFSPIVTPMLGVFSTEAQALAEAQKFAADTGLAECTPQVIAWELDVPEEFSPDAYPELDTTGGWEY